MTKMGKYSCERCGKKVFLKNIIYIHIYMTYQK